MPLDILVASPRDNETMYIGRIFLYNQATLGTTQNIAVVEGSQVHCLYIRTVHDNEGVKHTESSLSTAYMLCLII